MKCDKASGIIVIYCSCQKKQCASAITTSPEEGQPTTQARNCRKLPLQSSRPGSLSNVADLIRLQINVAQEISLMWSRQPEKLVKIIP